MTAPLRLRIVWHLLLLRNQGRSELLHRAGETGVSNGAVQGCSASVECLFTFDSQSMFTFVGVRTQWLAVLVARAGDLVFNTGENRRIGQLTL